MLLFEIHSPCSCSSSCSLWLRINYLLAISSLIGAFILYYSALNAAAFLHEKLLRNVLRSPVSFFDTTPLGRILNRFAKDVDVVDNTLPGVLRMWTACFFGVSYYCHRICYCFFVPYFFSCSLHTFRFVLIPFGTLLAT